MARMEGTKIICVLALIALGCEKSNLDVHFHEQFMLESTYTLPSEFLGGQVLFAHPMYDSLILFTDYYLRGIFSYNTRSNKVDEIGHRGRGPRGYLRPFFLTVIGPGEIAYSDLSSTEICFLNFTTNNERRIAHAFDGGRRFLVEEDVLFVLSNRKQYLVQHHLSSNVWKGFVDIEKELENLLPHIDGGGIVKLREIVYFMNPISPVIYEVNTATESVVQIIPDGWQRFKKNRDYQRLSKLNFSTWAAEKNEYAIFYRFAKIWMESEELFLVAYSYRGNRYCEIVDRYGKLRLRVEGDYHILGTINNKVLCLESSGDSQDNYTTKIHVFATAAKSRAKDGVINIQ